MLNIKDRNIYYIIGIGLLIRIIIFVFFYTHVSLFPDSSGYIELANKIQNFNLSGYSGLRSLGYPLFIALARGNLFLVVIFQFILGVIASVFWYKTLIQLRFSRKLALAISIFLSTLLNVIFFETTILTESLVLFFFSIVVYRLTNGYFEKTNAKNELLMSLLLGLLTLIKPFFAFLPFLFYALFLLKHNFSPKGFLNKRIIIFVFPLIAYFGWSYVNKLNTDYFVSTTFFGLNVAQNCVRFAEKAPEEYQWISEPYVKYREKSIQEDRDIAMSIWYAYNDGAYAEYNLNFNEFSAELGDFAIATIKANPWDYLQQVILYSWVDFWKPVIYWNYQDFNFTHANKLFLLVWYLQYAVLVLFRLFFLILIPYFIFQAIKKRKISIEFVLCMLVLSASILQAVVTYGTNSRFSFPFEFIMVFLVMLFLKDRNYLSFIGKIIDKRCSTRKNDTFNHYN